MTPSNLFKIPVKKLVNFACRTGDLHNTGKAGPTAAEGQKAHRKLQSLLRESEQAEVAVSATITIDDSALKLSGRVDILDDNPTLPIIAEIKSCYAPPDKIASSTVELHWSQLKVYGYCWLQQLKNEKPTDKLPDILLRLVWINVITDEITTDESTFTFTTLSKFTLDAVSKYLAWMTIIQSHRTKVQASAKALSFPYNAYRAGQREMAAAIYVSARDKGSFLCEAPTGIGKTVSAIFPAIKAIGEEHINSIVYLTAKNSGREAATDTILSLQRAGLAISAITITSKKTTCHCSNGTCDRNSDGKCPLTTGFFDRLPAAREKLMSQGVITPDAIDTAAHQYALCPFELTQQMLPWVTLVICDYNYVFDPLVRFSHFSENASQILLLIDEAHNLVDRARSMYSAKLDRQQIKLAISETNHSHPFPASELKGLIRSLDRWANKSSEQEFSENCTPKTVTRAVSKCSDAMAASEDSVAPTEAQIDVAKELYRYIVIENLFGDQHRTLTSHSRYKNNRRIHLKLQCLNASSYLQNTLKQFRSTVAFSATLRPQQYFIQSLGMPETTRCMALPSPFDPAGQGTWVCNWIDTRYQARDKSISSIADITYQVYGAKRGNYQVFFPSYAFMEKVYEDFTRRYPSIPVIIQQRGSSEQQRQEFLEAFNQSNTTLAFAIMGGIFGEGVDYVGNKLIGSIIIGTGLPSISLQQKLIEQDFIARGFNGFDYGSRYPGLTRVLQTAGRVIRSETDTGVVVLIDQRFNHKFYVDLFPAHWRVENCSNADELGKSMDRFWSRHFELTN